MSMETVPKGYKQTEVGMIPEEWTLKPIKGFAEIRGRVGWKGYTKKDLVPIGPYAIGAKHIDKYNRINLSEPTCLSMKKYEESPEIMVVPGDILIVQRGTIGKIAFVDQDYGKATINPSMAIIRVKQVSAKYVACFLLSDFGNSQIASDTSSTGVPMISQKQIGSFIVPLPPSITEQQAIAAALSDADALIESLEQLLTKKRQIKQGAMQELLTGKRRLPGFTHNWETTLLGDICTLKSGESITSKDIYPSGDYLCYGGNGIRGYAKSFTHNGCFLLIGRVGALCGNINLVEGRIYASEHVLVGTVREGVSHSWLALILERLKLNRLSEASAQPVLTSTKLSILEINLPTLPEQTAIAAVLSDMDAELEALEAKLDKARQIKQGMMQQLLTGKVRLV
ncbi:MAG: restriction endonuclease subunit S [Fibrobacteria bacterium]|nr:restriction endonuclease subunit S [Fibrobacteria bacterium]